MTVLTLAAIKIFARAIRAGIPVAAKDQWTPIQRSLIASLVANRPKGGSAKGLITFAQARELVGGASSEKWTQLGRFILERCTPEELINLQTGDLNATTLSRLLHKDKSTKERKKWLAAPKQVRGGQRRAREDTAMKAELYRALSGALTKLSGMPLASDVAEMLRSNKRLYINIDARLAASVKWLTDFATAWAELRATNGNNNGGGIEDVKEGIDCGYREGFRNAGNGR